MVMPTNAQPRVMIDWYDDGTWDDAIDDVSDIVAGHPGLSVEWGRDTARSTSPPMIGAAACDLLNEDRMLSPENPASARYQFVLPGRPVKIDVEHGTESAYRENDDYRVNDPYRGVGVFPLMLGHTSSFTQRIDWGDRRVEMGVLDRLAQLKRKRVSVALSGPIRTDSAAGFVLDAAGWPSDMYALAVSESIMNQWWVDERPAWDVLVELLATEGAGAAFYVDGSGVFHWLNRNHRATAARSLTVQATFLDVASGSNLFYTRLVYDPRWEDVIDRVTVNTRQRLLAGSETVIWQLGTTITVQPLELRTIWARPTDPFRNAVQPVDPTDYTVSGGVATVSLIWSDGAVAKINIFGNSGVSTVSGLQLRGYSYPVVGETQIEAESDVSTDADAKTLAISAWPELDMNHAQAIANSYLARYGESRPILELTFQNASGAHMDAILALQISDRVAITNQHLGLSGFECYVEKIKHVMTVGGKHEVTIWCEPVSPIGSLGDAWGAAIWDTSVWGI